MDKVSLLLRYADMVLVCDGGRTVPCVRFHMLPDCAVVRNLVEDVELKKDGDNRVMVPFPAVDAEALELATSVIHGVRDLAGMTVHDLGLVRSGMAVLGNTRYDEAVHEEIWSRVRDGPMDGMQPHLDGMLHTESIRWEVLSRAITACPMWRAFSKDVLDHVHMDVALARWLLCTLVMFYPAGPAYAKIVSLIPPACVDDAKLLELFSPDVATWFHPLEARDVLACTRRGCKSPSVTGFLSAMQRAMYLFAAPHIAQPLCGSVLSVEGWNAESVLLEAKEKKGAVTRKMTDWLTLVINWQTGDVDARVYPSKFALSRPKLVELRLSAYSAAAHRPGETFEEVWYSKWSVAPHPGFSALNTCTLRMGNVEAFREAVRSYKTDRLRVDVFFNDRSVFSCPIVWC